MPRVHGIQTNFSGGTFSPKLEGRLDLPRYGNAVRTLKNMTVMRQGGATRRNGFHLLEGTKFDVKKSRLIPFIYSSEIAYQLEFGDQYIRFCKDGYQINYSVGTEKIVNGSFTYDIGYWTNISVATGTATWSTGKLKLSGGTNLGAVEQAIIVKNAGVYTITLDVFTNSIKIRIGTTTTGQEILADAVKAAGSHVVTFTATAPLGIVYIGLRNDAAVDAYVDNVSCREGTELITNPTMNTNIAGYTDLSTGTGSITAVGGAMDLAGGATGIGWAEESVATTIGVKYCVMCDVAVKSLKIRIGTATGGEQILADTTIPVGVENKVIFTATSATTYIGFKKSENETSTLDNVFVRTWNIFEIVSPYLEADLPKIRYVQYIDTLFLVHPNYPPCQLICGGDVDWRIIITEFIDGPYMDEETTPTITTNATAIGATVNLVASAPLFVPGHEGALWRLKNVATWGYVVITDFTDSTHAVGLIKTTLGAAGPTVAQREGSWSAYRGYPSVVRFFEDRIVYGGSLYQPQTQWGSKSGNYDDFTPGVLDSDAFYYTLASKQLNTIRWMEATKVLIIGTSGVEFKAAGGADNPISPTNIDVKPVGTNGSAEVDSIAISNVVIFVERSNKKLLELVYSWESDSYVDEELSSISDDLIEDGIEEIAYQQNPNPIIWIRTTNGNLVGFSYKRSYDTVAWHYHPTDGIIESISVIPNATTGEDGLSAIINRGTLLVPKRYIEYLDPDLNTDSALTYSGLPVTSVSGLDHLIGKTVDIVGDGAVYPSKVVDAGGNVALEGSSGCSNIEVGLHYESELETMRPEFPIAGTSQGIPKHWSQVFVRLYKSIGVTIGDEMIPFRTSDDPMGEGIETFTGDKRVSKLGWDKEGRIRVRQTQPLPLTVLSIFGTLELGD